MNQKTINIRGISELGFPDILLNITDDEFEKVAAYSHLEHVAPEVFWRRVVKAGIKAYEIYGVL